MYTDQTFQSMNIMWLMQQLWFCLFLLSPTFLYMQLISEVFSCITWRHINFNRSNTELIISSWTFISLYFLFESKIPWSNKLPSQKHGSHSTIHPLYGPPHPPAHVSVYSVTSTPSLGLPCGRLGWGSHPLGCCTFCKCLSVFISEPLWYSLILPV